MPVLNGAGCLYRVGAEVRRQAPRRTAAGTYFLLAPLVPGMLKTR